MSVKMRGLIIREINTGEANKILTVLTEKDGKISVFAKNIRRVKGRFGAGAAFLCFSDFELDPSRNELYYLRRAVPVKNFFSLSESIEKLALATYMGQLAASVVPEGVLAEGNALPLLLNTFYVLSESDKPLKFIKSVFEFRLMAEEGYAPRMEGCAGCGKIVYPMHFYPKEGIILCNECRGDGIFLSEGLYKALFYIVTVDIKKLFAFTIGEENLEIFSKLSEDYCIYQIGKTFPALDYLKALL